MSKKKPQFKIDSYGRYSKWERGSKELPHIEEFTETIQSIDGNEFGMILNIKSGKGICLEYCIKHPSFKNSEGIIESDFTGEHFVNSNDYRFFIGDCVWLPVEDKVGTWEVSVKWEDKIIAEKKFELVP